MQFWEIAAAAPGGGEAAGAAERGKCAVPRLPALSQSGVPPLPPAAKSHDGAGAALGVAGLSGSALVSPDGSVAGEGLE